MALKEIGQAWSTPDDSELFTRMLGGCLKLAPDILGGTFSGNPNAEKQSFQTTWAIGIVSQDEAGVKTRVADDPILRRNVARVSRRDYQGWHSGRHVSIVG